MTYKEAITQSDEEENIMKDFMPAFIIGAITGWLIIYAICLR